MSEKLKKAKKKSLNAKPKNLVARKPVARFYYKGAHTHPVRRTILITEETPDMIVGYELREGSLTRTLSQAMKTIKSYSKDKIANWGDYSRLRMTAKNIFKSPKESTLERLSITEIFGNEI